MGGVLRIKFYWHRLVLKVVFFFETGRDKATAVQKVDYADTEYEHRHDSDTEYERRHDCAQNFSIRVLLERA